MKSALPVFDFLIDAAQRGADAALVTLTDVVGGSSRSPGAQMAVTADGGNGSLSAGCVEAAIVAEARRVIATGRAERLRFGQGSRFMDVRLPCGGAIDLLVTPQPDLAALLAARERLAARQGVAMVIDESGGPRISPDTARGASAWREDGFIVRHAPDLRIVIAGNGAETLALARLAKAFGATILVLTTEEILGARIGGLGLEATLLAHRADVTPLVADPDTAFVVLFHDHVRETALLVRALSLDPFYIGAMGSRQTHAHRLETLAKLGVQPAALAKIRGPIGFIPASRDPETLALSVLGEVVAAHQERLRADLNAHPTQET